MVSRIIEDPGLVRAAEKACKDQEVQDGINHLIDELAKGNPGALAFHRNPADLSPHDEREVQCPQPAIDGQ